jgi:acetolactate decarboxylase
MKASHFSGNRPTLYQVSTSAALVQGVSQGAIRVGAIPELGNFGLGTFEDLDGEMIVLDGLVFQLRGDGSVRQPDANVLGAFVAMTRFVPDAETKVERSPDLTTLLSHFDPLRRSDNLFYALRVEGMFDYIHARSM